jgi:hypothetical protein
MVYSLEPGDAAGGELDEFGVELFWVVVEYGSSDFSDFFGEDRYFDRWLEGVGEVAVAPIVRPVP